jgi:Domain of unknown function (DUF6894)
MPRYFFHIRGPDGRITDEAGLEFHSLDDAVADARRARGEMLVDAAQEKSTKSSRVFEITDGSGQVLAIVPLLEL